MTSEPNRPSEDLLVYSRGMPTPANNSEAKPAASAIDAAYQALVLVIQGAQAAVRRQHLEVPETFTMAAPYVPGRVLAYFGAGRWSVGGQIIGEIALAANYLDRGGEHAMECLLHESVHAACAALGVRDTSRTGRYHNSRFAECAEQFGLVVERHRVIGHATAGLVPEALSTYAVEVAALDRVLGILRRLRVVEVASTTRGDDVDGEKSPPPYVSAICRCVIARGLPRRLRMSRGAWAFGEVRCSVCGDPFAEEGLDQSCQRRSPPELRVESIHRRQIEPSSQGGS